MKRLLGVVMVLLFSSALMPAQTGNAQAEQEVRELRHRFNEALLKVDVPTMNEVLAEEFLVVRSNGGVANKVEVVKDIISGKTKFETIEEVQEVSSRIYGDSAVMTTLEKMVGQAGGNVFSTQMRNSYVCVKRDGRWVLVLRQATPVRPPQPEATSAK